MTKSEIIKAIEVLGFLLKGAKANSEQPIVVAMKQKMLELINKL